ncbi:hypothetical protein [Bdellovibrio sp. GT3]|uniref:hypothetical protein n=1 Tax=Bdellovibrio sp. GT3 TaxID=3136282 RepID=UPI0030F303F0
MRTPMLFLAGLIISAATPVYAAPSSNMDQMINDYSNSPDVDRALRSKGVFQRPGVLPCPDQSQMTKMNDLAKLENHSKDCHPSAGGALRVDPDRPDGEVRGSEVPAQFH